MALLPTKTYSKRNNELSVLNDKEKENVDPFDELLSSPLKQDVPFQPLSFWGRKVRELESQKKSKTIKCGLFETSDSDDQGSPLQRKRKIKSKSLVSKRTLQPNCRNSNFSVRKKNNYSTACSLYARTKPHKSIVPNKTKSSILAEEFCKGKNRLSSRTVGLDSDEMSESCFSSLQPVQFKENRKSSREFSSGNINEQNLKFKIYEDPDDKNTFYGEKSVNCTLHFNESMEETLKPIHEGHSSINNFNDDVEYFINDTLLSTSNENMGKSVCLLNSTTLITEESEAISVEDNSVDYMSFDSMILEDLMRELLEQHYGDELNRVTGDFSSTSDDTLSELNDEDTVIKVALDPETNPSPTKDLEEVAHSASPSNEVPQLTSRISDLIISNATDDELSESEHEPGIDPETESEADTGKSDILQEDENRADKEDSFLIDLRNVTTKRKRFLYEENPLGRLRTSALPNTVQNNVETELECDQTFQFPRLTDRMSFDWNKTVSFANPVFESTRVLDMSIVGKKVSQRQTVFEESGFDHTVVLKPGKKWLRSMSVLKQLQNGDISKGRLESTRITGRKFESFVQDMMEMQNEGCKVSNKTWVNAQSVHDGLIGHQGVLNLENDSYIGEFFSVNDSILPKSTVNETVSEKVLLNRTVKVVQPEESSSAFRSALGLETSHVTIQEESAEHESSCISARQFILIQCGQEDVLPFEEYFNERTLINCKKIGEGVYGEVFMCSDTVIKIIPIEGSDKVNGEPQKTFEEIMSEVVIASKLSNLRKGEKHQTDGFSEMKRCWCVKGKYPEYLLRLWNEFDELGSGSENDSPIMFKDDQLYIILELANGGKDLESFVFTSAAQSLSVFIQAAFSLAVAEKAFEFEHRDLHWGNVLISPTKDKFMTVTLNGTKYKIPTKGVKVCIIDFTLSRINHEGCCIFNDLSVDPGLFASEGDYQFEIYRMMLREVNNDWSLFRPKNNLFWLHYMLDKMINMVRYKSKKGKVHASHVKNMRSLESVVLEYSDSTSFVLSNCLSKVISSL